MYWIRDADKKAISVKYIVSFEIFDFSSVEYFLVCTLTTGARHILERNISNREAALEKMERFIWTIQHSIFAAKMSDEMEKQK